MEIANVNRLYSSGTVIRYFFFNLDGRSAFTYMQNQAFYSLNGLDLCYLSLQTKLVRYFNFLQYIQRMQGFLTNPEVFDL